MKPHLILLSFLLLFLTACPAIDLNTAIKNKDIELAKKLIESGEDLNIQDSSGSAPLRLALSINNLELFKLLLFKGADVNLQDKSGKTPLHWVALSRDFDIGLAVLLIEHGADVNVTDVFNQTPLHFAVFAGRLDMVLFLNNNKARTDIKNDAGQTPLDIAKSNKRKDIEIILSE